MNDAAPSSDELDLESFYAYGYRAKNMFAVRSPFAMSGDAGELIGRRVRIAGGRYEILGVWRQISGPIAKGETIGVEARPAVPTPDAR